MPIRAKIILLGFACVIVLFGCRNVSQAQNLVCARKACYDVELATTAQEMSLGLMHRKHMARDKGMLFIFYKSAIQPFWMKNTLISLDMIWMDHARFVVHIEENVPPCTGDPCPRYTPSREALYVLELNAGEVERIGLQLGDQFEFKIHQ